MKSCHKLLFLTIFVFLLFIKVAVASIYYVDAATGNDSDDGQSAANAWATVAGGNGVPYTSGDFIYIKNGSIWEHYAAPLHISETTGAEMITIIRYYLDETTATFWTDAELLEWINKAIRNIANLTHCMDTIEPITLSTGALFYDITTEYITIKYATYYYETSAYLLQENGDRILQENGDGILISNIKSKGLKVGSREHVGRVTDVGEPVYWFVWKDQVCIYPLAGSAVNGNMVKLFLAAKPYTIISSANIPIPAIFDAAIAYYATSQALDKSDQKSKAEFYLNQYYDTISRYRVDIADKPKSIEIKP